MQFSGDKTVKCTCIVADGGVRVSDIDTTHMNRIRLMRDLLFGQHLVFILRIVILLGFCESRVMIMAARDCEQIVFICH